jgi:hypothetical protein
MSQTFKLDTASLVQILGDPEFYPANLAFLHLRDQGLAAVRQHLAEVSRKAKDPGCCDGKADDRRFLVGPINVFVRTLAQLLELESSAGLDQLRNYIEKRLGRPVAEITLTYRNDAGKEQTLKF